MAELKKSDVWVLIPAFNEERRIQVVVSRARALGFPVAVADDGSRDATAERAREAGAEVLKAEKNQGKGASLARGFTWCLERGAAAVIAMDADGQHDPAELEDFFKALNAGKGDVIVGNRMAEPGKMPFIRLSTNRFMSFIISHITRQEIPDSQCGYRAMTKAALEKMRLRTQHFEIESEILLEAGRLGLRIASLPIRSVYEGGKSEINPIRDTLRFFSFLFSYHFK